MASPAHLRYVWSMGAVLVRSAWEPDSTGLGTSATQGRARRPAIPRLREALSLPNPPPNKAQIVEGGLGVQMRLGVRRRKAGPPGQVLSEPPWGCRRCPPYTRFADQAGPDHYETGPVPVVCTVLYHHVPGWRHRRSKRPQSSGMPRCVRLPLPLSMPQPQPGPSPLPFPPPLLCSDPRL